jgi:hypothetical protein
MIFKKFLMKNLKIYILYGVQIFLKSNEKIGESYQHRNVFIEKHLWEKSGNIHNHVLILPH